MKKILIPLIILFVLTVTVSTVIAGEESFRKSPQDKICVESRICAVNYMNSLEEKKQ
jgi:hypothetical protein